ncbi:hypothetical protein DM02DRAFT_636480, partial [Periconia macrospinosa]
MSSFKRPYDGWPTDPIKRTTQGGDVRATNVKHKSYPSSANASEFYREQKMLFPNLAPRFQQPRAAPQAPRRDPNDRPVQPQRPTAREHEIDDEHYTFLSLSIPQRGVYTFLELPAPEREDSKSANRIASRPLPRHIYVQTSKTSKTGLDQIIPIIERYAYFSVDAKLTNGDALNDLGVGVLGWFSDWVSGCDHLFFILVQCFVHQKVAQTLAIKLIMSAQGPSSNRHGRMVSSMASKTAWMLRGTGKMVHSIPASTIQPASAEVSSESGFEVLCGYNWHEDEKTISVPGGPPKWAPLPLPATLSPNSDHRNMDQVTTQVPVHPFEPVFQAMSITNPDMRLDEVDIIVNRNSLRKLLDFVSGKQQYAFRMDLHMVKDTLFICRRERNFGSLVHGPHDPG